MDVFFTRTCQCSSKQLARSRRRNRMERIISFLLLPYYCSRCGTRMYKLRLLGISGTEGWDWAPKRKEQPGDADKDG